MLQDSTASVNERWASMKLLFLDRLWLGFLVVTVLAVPASLARFQFLGSPPPYLGHTLFLVLVVACWLLRRRLRYETRAVVLLFLMDLVAVAGLIKFAQLGAAWTWMLMAGLLSGLLFHLRVGVIHTIVALLVICLFGTAYVTGALTLDFDANEFNTRPAAWIALVAGPVLLTIFGFWAVGIFVKTSYTLLQELEERRAHSAGLLAELEQSLTEIKTLRGFLPICSGCKKIRNDTGYWQHVESYLQAHSDVTFTHALCPPCGVELYGELWHEAMQQPDPVSRPASKPLSP